MVHGPNNHGPRGVFRVCSVVRFARAAARSALRTPPSRPRCGAEHGSQAQAKLIMIGQGQDPGGPSSRREGWRPPYARAGPAVRRRANPACLAAAVGPGTENRPGLHPLADGARATRACSIEPTALEPG